MSALVRLQKNSGTFAPALKRGQPRTLTERLGLARPLVVTVPEHGLAARLAALADPANVVRGINTGMLWLRRYREHNWPNILRGLEKIALCEALGLPGHFGTWYVRHLRRDGDILDYGLVSTRVVTTVGAAFVIDAWQAAATLNNMKFHGIGTTNTAEAVGDTGLAAEVTTGLNPDSTRATATLSDGSGANILRGVATNTVDASVTIVEAGLFSQAATGGGTLFDRGIFGGIAMVATDQLETTHDWTLNTGG
jgi:hypothetical protein